MFGIGIPEIIIIVLVAAILYFVYKESKNKVK